MFGSMLRDPKVRRAYILTKAGVLALAAAATWPLSWLIGPRAWYGLGAFAVVLVGLTVALLAATAGAEPETDADGDDGAVGGEDEDEEPLAEAVVIPIEDHIDLHPFPPGQVPEVVEAYLEAALEKGFDEVRLIHGRGIGVQRERVRRLLSRLPMVESYSDATQDRGGWGATVAVLRTDWDPTDRAG